MDYLAAIWFLLVYEALSWPLRLALTPISMSGDTRRLISRVAGPPMIVLTAWLFAHSAQVGRFLIWPGLHINPFFSVVWYALFFLGAWLFCRFQGVNPDWRMVLSPITDRARWKREAFVEVTALVIFFSYLWFRRMNPDMATHVVNGHGSEKFDNAMFFWSSWHARSLPPEDYWLAGNAMHYYYYGQFFWAWIGRFSFLPGEWIITLGLARLTQLVWESSYLVLRSFGARSVSAALGAILACWMSNPASVRTAVKQYDNFSGYSSQLMQPIEKREGSRWDKKYRAAFDDPNKKWDWGAYAFWEPAHGTIPNNIVEFPAWTAMLGDFHAHHLSLPWAIGLVALVVAGHRWLRFRSLPREAEAAGGMESRRGPPAPDARAWARFGLWFLMFWALGVSATASNVWALGLTLATGAGVFLWRLNWPSEKVIGTVFFSVMAGLILGLLATIGLIANGRIQLHFAGTLILSIVLIGVIVAGIIIWRMQWVNWTLFVTIVFTCATWVGLSVAVGNYFKYLITEASLAGLIIVPVAITAILTGLGFLLRRLKCADWPFFWSLFPRGFAIAALGCGLGLGLFLTMGTVGDPTKAQVEAVGGAPAAPKESTIMVLSHEQQSKLPELAAHWGFQAGAMILGVLAFLGSRGLRIIDNRRALYASLGLLACAIFSALMYWYLLVNNKNLEPGAKVLNENGFVWLILASFFGMLALTRRPFFRPLGVVFVCLTLVLLWGLEVVFINDAMGGTHERYNSYFKNAVPAWPLMTAGAWMCLHRVWHMRRFVIFPVIAPVQWALRAAMLVALPFAFALVIFGGPSRVIMARLMSDSGTPHRVNPKPTLNAFAWGVNLPSYRSDANLLAWIRDHVPPRERVAEVVTFGGTDRYNYRGRVASLAGRPVPLGWNGHQYTWRSHKFAEPIGLNYQILNDLYNSPSSKAMADAARKLDVKWIMFGKNEVEQFKGDRRDVEAANRVYQNLLQIADVKVMFGSGERTVFLFKLRE